MARYKFRNSKPKTEINMAPINLIDVVLLLLIFFVTTSTFKKETGVKIERPQAKKVINLSKNSNQNILTITSENKIAVNKKEVAVEELDGLVQELKTNAKSSLIIISDKKTDVGILIKILDILNGNEYKNYSIAVDKEK